MHPPVFFFQSKQWAVIWETGGLHSSPSPRRCWPYHLGQIPSPILASVSLFVKQGGQHRHLISRTHGSQFQWLQDPLNQGHRSLLFDPFLIRLCVWDSDASLGCARHWKERKFFFFSFMCYIPDDLDVMDYGIWWHCTLTTIQHCAGKGGRNGFIDLRLWLGPVYQACYYVEWLGCSGRDKLN